MTKANRLSVNRMSLKQKINSYKKHPFSLLALLLVCAAAAVAVLSLVFLVVYILIKGVPYLSPSLFEPEYNSENVSMLPAIINTLIMMVSALILALPAGIGAAIYLSEYARRGNKFVEAVRITAETLSGIPSIVYGLFGSLFFVLKLKMGLSLISGAATLAIMILPLIMRTTEEALLSIPDTYREASFGLGAGKLRTVFRVILPAAVPGILSGIILAIGRIIGESAALLYTAGTYTKIVSSLSDSSRTLAVHMYVLSNEGLYINETYATAVVLLILVILVNALSDLVAKRLTKGKERN
ncbi:MAG: phosphate ABC transporter permease PstA [Firmicutes bacterium]|nr:phosphate ABC transporter permease PstA [Bacillota bacterium]